MEFRLVYRGPLGSAGHQRGKHEKNVIRRVFHGQLAELWRQHSGLRNLSDPKREAGAVTRHRKEANFIIPNKNGDPYKFLYLIGDKHGISCSLDILFLRRESAGGLVTHGGDLDNRLKLLFDALRMPSTSEELPDTPPAADEDPFHCVLEDDKFIDKVTVNTDRLLMPLESRINEREHDVLLIVGVKTIIFDTLRADWWVTTDR